MAADISKLRSLIAHIARSKPGLGKVRLFKLLYLVDFKAFAETGESITGEMYENFEMGPVPKTLWKSFAGITSACVSVDSVDTGIGVPEQQMTVRPDFVSTLTDQEAAIADAILAKYGNHSGNSLKKITHDQIPYLATKRGADIPYGLAGYLFFRRPSSEDLTAVKSDQALVGRVREAVAKASRHRGP